MEKIHRGVSNPCREALCADAESSPRSVAPTRGSGASAPKGSPEWRLEQGRKEKAGQNNLVIPRPVLTLVVGIRFFFRQQYVSARHRGDADSHVASLLGMTEVFYALSVLFPISNFCTLATPQSASQPPAPLVVAPSGCSAANAPVRNLCRGALPLLGEVPSAHTGERGRQSIE